MIQPIRAVGLCEPGGVAAAHCQFRLSLACVLQFRNLNGVWADHRARMEIPNQIAAPLADVLAARLRCSSELACRASLALPASPPQTETVEAWRPWPAHGPFATEVRRWWPSDDFPPPEPVVIHDVRQAATPVAIQRPAVGMLIDYWV